MITGPSSSSRPIDLNGSGQIYATVTTAASIYKSNWTPVGIPLDISFTTVEKTITGSAGAVFCSNLTDTDTGSYYLLRYDSGGNFQLYKIINGSATSLGSWAGTASTSLSLTLRVSGGNNVFTATVGGAAQTPVTDSSSPLSAGSVGVWQIGDGNSAHGEQLDSINISDPAATTFTLTGPTGGPVLIPSGVFTVTPNGATTGTFTPNAQTGCTFTPSTLTLSGTTPKTFTVTRSSAGSSTINGTTSDSLTPPTSITYTAKATISQYLTVDGGVPGLASTTTIGILNPDGTNFADPTSTGVADLTNGSYGVTVTIPSDLSGSYQWVQGLLIATTPLSETAPSGGSINELINGGLIGVR
jgi:hypothetical protein